MEEHLEMDPSLLVADLHASKASERKQAVLQNLNTTNGLRVELLRDSTLGVS